MCHSFSVRVAFTRSTRKHRIGRAHVLSVMATTIGIPVPRTPDHDPQVVWIGLDDRGVALEVIPFVLPDVLLVHHVMPYDFRRNR